jgi:hypothetical protein
LKPEYLKLERIWDDIPAIHELAKTISPDDSEFVYLHAAQLIKHILGLKAKVGKTRFRLLYLWYDVLGQEGAAHWKEIENFTKVARADDINFHALSYQKLIFRLASEFRQGHEEYISYLTGRYL